MEGEVIKETGLVPSQPGRNLTITSLHGKSRPKISFFEKDEILSLIAGIPVGRERALFQFLWMTGCRVTEVITLKKQDLDFVNNEVTVRWQKSRKWKHRVIPMHHQLREILLIYTAAFKSDDLLFPFSRQRAWQLAKRYDFGHPHKLRHSFAVNFLRNNTSSSALRMLQLLLGHSKINTTMEYLNFVPMHQAEELNKVDFMNID